jgi:hypothetical protein
VAALVGELDLGRAGEAVFGGQRRRAVANHQDAGRHMGTGR